MAADDLPEPEDAVKEFKDEANLITMLSGGLIISAVVYYLVKTFLEFLFDMNFTFIPLIFSVLIIWISVKLGTSTDVQVKMNKKSGWIEAENQEYVWEGYANELELFNVLERETPGRGQQTIREYKLTLRTKEEEEEEIIQFDVPIQPSNAKDAIKWVNDVKEAVPGGQQNPDEIISS